MQAFYQSQYSKEHLITNQETPILANIKESGGTTKELERIVMLFSAVKESASSGSELSRLVIDANNFPTVDQAAEAIKKNIAVNTNVENTTISTINQVGNSLSNRIHDITGTSNPSGLAAGDNEGLEQKQYGVWFTPLYSQVQQKTNPDSLGYKVKSTGKIIGADTRFNDDLSTLGVACSMINSSIKYPTGYADKTKTNSIIFSLYGKHNLTGALFAQSLVSYSSTKVELQEERIFSSGNQIAKANYTSRTYNGQILLGYDTKLDKMSLTPFFGISYMKLQNEAYTETGLAFANRQVAAHDSDRISFITGAKLSTTINTNNGTTITPEIRGSIHKLIGSKGGKIVTKINGMNNPFVDTPEAIKTIGNLGIGLTAKSGILEYGLGYDAMLVTKKVVGHQGEFKLRVSF